MVEGRRKSRSFRRLRVRIPSGRSITHYTRRKPGKAQCSSCGAYLKGVPRARSTEIHNMPKSFKRPERPYGGVLCSRCTRQTIVNKFRGIFSLSKK